MLVKENIKKMRILVEGCCKRLHFIVLTLFFISIIIQGYSQDSDNFSPFSIPEGQSKVEIPFENHNNLIIIKIKIGGKISSKFILDSGARGTVLIEKVIGDFLGFNYTDEYRVAGAGAKGAIKAFLAEDVDMKIKGLESDPMDIFVLQEDYLQLPKYLGIRVQGILGIDFFKNLIVQIDYDERKLIVHDPETFKAPKKFQTVNLSGLDEKPYIRGKINVEAQQRDTARFLVDTGASHAILIEMNEENNIPLPEKHIESSLGRGLSGNISGYIARVNAIKLGKHGLALVIASFTREYSKIQKKGRVGTIGGELLSRFNVILDMPNNLIHFKPAENFNDTFEFNMSGMQLAAFGENLNRIKVDYVKEGSPADNAGIKKGDEILKLNWVWIELYSLSHIYSILRSREDRTIRLKILRDDEKMKFKFDLERLI